MVAKTDTKSSGSTDLAAANEDFRKGVSRTACADALSLCSKEFGSILRDLLISLRLNSLAPD
jgi:hypothetical protein